MDNRQDNHYLASPSVDYSLPGDLDQWDIDAYLCPEASTDFGPSHFGDDIVRPMTTTGSDTWPETQTSPQASSFQALTTMSPKPDQGSSIDTELRSFAQQDTHRKVGQQTNQPPQAIQTSFQDDSKDNSQVLLSLVDEEQHQVQQKLHHLQKSILRARHSVEESEIKLKAAAQGVVLNDWAVRMFGGKPPPG